MLCQPPYYNRESIRVPLSTTERLKSFERVCYNEEWTRRDVLPGKFILLQQGNWLKGVLSYEACTAVDPSLVRGSVERFIYLEHLYTHVTVGPPDMLDAFDRSNGNGSRNSQEDWLDEHTTSAKNEWSTAATTFYISDAPPHRQQHFEALYRTHNGWGEQSRKDTIRRSHVVNDAETFVSILELPTYQRERVIEIAEDIDLSSKRFGGKSYEKILLAVCSLVSDEALSDKCDPSIENRIVFTDEFKQLMEANGLGSREHNRIRQMIRERSNYF